MSNEYNYIGKVIIIRPGWAKNGMPYLFRVSGGSGAQSGFIGTGVFGNFLCDDSYEKIHCGDIWRLATEEEIEAKQVNLESFAWKYKNLYVGSRISEYQSYIYESLIENRTSDIGELRKMKSQISDIILSDQTEAEILEKLKQIYETVRNY